ILTRLHPLVRKWFKETFEKPSDPQAQGWPAIASGEHTLILAPTGTGKTLAAFLWELNELIRRGAKEPLPNAVHLLYISPLKALNNDIQRNLDRPLTELRERLETLVEKPPQRIGLSATQRPLEEVARFLGGCEKSSGAPSFRPVTIVDCGMTKEMQISIESPVADLGNIGGSIWPAVAPLVL